MMKAVKALLFPFPGAAVFCLVISGLLYQLNPATDVKTWFITALKLFPLYGTAIYLAGFVFALTYSFFADRPARIGFFTFFTHLTFFLSFSVACIIYFYNYFHFFMLLDDFSRTIMFAQSCILAAAVLIPILIIVRYSKKDKGHGIVGYFILIIITSAVILTPFVFSTSSTEGSGTYHPSISKDRSSERKLIILGFDTATMDIVLPMVSEGRLPNFDDMLKKGSWARLKNFRPTLGPPVWTSSATGHMPDRHGIKDYSKFTACEECTEYRLVPKGMLFRKLTLTGLFRDLDFSVSDRKTEAYWNILNRLGLSTGTVNWPYTSPAEEVSGFFVSDKPGFYPPHLKSRFNAITPPNNPFQKIINDSLSIDPDRGGRLLKASVDDLHYNLLAMELYREFAPQVMTLNLSGLEQVSHHFYRFHNPAKFGNVSSEKKELYGPLIENYYIYLDSLLGQWIGLADKNTTVMIFSPYGIEPMATLDRLSKHLLLETPMSGSHQNAPDGLIIVTGNGIKEDYYLETASILDIVPTLLYMLDLPAAYDMTGNILTDIFTEEYRQSHPVSFITSYDDLTVISENIESYQGD